ncbi:hypothetical protein [Methanoregula sp.]|uniref:hypothetical protein n=1 Tax=Methanoregula sp. TaxID=2052170 RepID=UPI003BAEB6BC
MEKSKVLREHAIFPKGEKIANDHFIGTAWLRVLVPDDSTFHCPVFNVIFEPGARNNWHEHPGGQILLITGAARDITRKKAGRSESFARGMW